MTYRQVQMMSKHKDPKTVMRYDHGRENMEQNAGHQVPNWLEWNPAQLTGSIKALPTPEDVPFEINLNLIIEFYR